MVKEFIRNFDGWVNGITKTVGISTEYEAYYSYDNSGTIKARLGPNDMYPVHYLHAGADVIADYIEDSLELDTTYYHGVRDVDDVLSRWDYTASPVPDRLDSFKDILGSVLYVENESGTKIQETLYSPFGRGFEVEGNSPHHYMFTGREWDADMYEYYYRARWYDPEIGRFVSPDRIDMASTSTYIYVLNNPLMMSDPSGYQEWNPTPPGDNCGCYDTDVSNDWKAACLKSNNPCVPDYFQACVKVRCDSSYLRCGGFWCIWPGAWGYSDWAGDTHLCKRQFTDTRCQPTANTIFIEQCGGGDLTSPKVADACFPRKPSVPGSNCPPSFGGPGPTRYH